MIERSEYNIPSVARPEQREGKLYLVNEGDSVGDEGLDDMTCLCNEGYSVDEGDVCIVFQCNDYVINFK